MEDQLVSHDIGADGQSHIQAHHSPAHLDKASLDHMDALCRLTFSDDPAVRNSAYANLSAMIYIPQGYQASGSAADTNSATPPSLATSSSEASTSSTPAALPTPSGSIHVSAPTKLRWSRSDLDDEDVPSGGPGDIVTCRWLGCEHQGEGESLYRTHIATDSGHIKDLKNTDGEGKIYCRWQGCQRKPMMPSSLERHVKNIHLKMMSFTCSRCHKCSRADSYLKDHGPARLCRRGPAVQRMPPGGISDLTAVPGPSYTAPAIGPAPLFQSSAGPIRTRGVYTRRAAVQQKIAYPVPATYPHHQGLQGGILSTPDGNVQPAEGALPLPGAGLPLLVSQLSTGPALPPRAGLHIHVPAPVRAFGPDFLPPRKLPPFLRSAGTAPRAHAAVTANAVQNPNVSTLAASAGNPGHPRAPNSVQSLKAPNWAGPQGGNAWRNDENVPPPLF